VEFLGHDVQAGYVVGVLVSDEHGGERLRSNALEGKTAAGFAAGEATVDEYARVRRCNHRAVARAARGQNCNGNRHAYRIAGKGGVSKLREFNVSMFHSFKGFTGSQRRWELLSHSSREGELPIFNPSALRYFEGTAWACEGK
jgi:hypothetical protein